MRTTRSDIQEQIDYYRAQAPSYRRVDLASGSLAMVRERLRELGPCRHILELAPGSGDWTRELIQMAETVTAIDAAPEMIEINRGRVADSRVQYIQADLFEWVPQRRYDLVFFAFWLSHVPPDLVDAFLVKVHNAVRTGGHLFIVDQCDDYPDIPRAFSTAQRDGIFEKRSLSDGRAFRIVKIFYHPRLLAERVSQLGFEVAAERLDTIFYLRGKRL